MSHLSCRAMQWFIAFRPIWFHTIRFYFWYIKTEGVFLSARHNIEVLKKRKREVINELNEPHTIRNLNDYFITPCMSTLRFVGDNLIFSTIFFIKIVVNVIIIIFFRQLSPWAHCSNVMLLDLSNRIGNFEMLNLFIFINFSIVFAILISSCISILIPRFNF